MDVEQLRGSATLLKNRMKQVKDELETTTARGEKHYA